MLKTGIEPSAASASQVRVRPGAHADRLRRDGRGSARCRRSTPRARAASRRDAGSAGARPARRCPPRRRGACGCSASRTAARRRVPASASRRARRGLQLVRAVEQREQGVAVEFGAGEEVARQAREDSAVVRILTWNLFHGRAVPDVPRPLGGAFARMLAGWDWDVALLQEVPPWWPPRLARGVRRAGVHGADVARTGAAAGARGRRAAPGRREVVGRRRERDPRARRCAGDGACTAAAARCGPSGG